MPAATAEAEIVAASAIPKAVPRTALSALSMIRATSSVVLPSPSSFA